MPYTIRYDPETRIIETKIHGVVKLSDFKAIFSDALRLAVENGSFLFLSDFREAHINLSTLDIYDLPKLLSDKALPLGVYVGELKRAIVISESFKDARFSEDVTTNQGQWIKFFHDIEKAKHWLTETK